MRILPLLLFTALVTGCATQHAITPAPAPAAGTASVAGFIVPMEAVRAANDDPRRGISGTFVMTVQAADITADGIFLNSERDYRHPMTLTVRIPVALQDDVERQLGLPINRLVNRRILINGTARQTRINFISNGQPSDKYYFQTHIALQRPENLSLAP